MTLQSTSFETIGSVLSRLESSLRNGVEVNLDCLLQSLNPQHGREGLVEVLACVLSIGAWSSTRATAMFDRHSLSRDEQLQVLTYIFENRASNGERFGIPELSSFNPPPGHAGFSLTGDPVSIGEIVADRFQLLYRLGKGGFGVTYLADDLQGEQRVALKIANQLTKTGDPDEWLANEYHTGLKLAPLTSFPKVSSFGVDKKGRSYLARQFIDGVTLRHLMQQGPMDAADALGLIRRILVPLMATHWRGINHGDLKPENFMIDRAGHVLLLDFGFGKVSKEFRWRLWNRIEALRGRFPGSLYYAPPELVTLGQADWSRGETWAVGVMLLEMITGSNPVPEMVSRYPGHDLRERYTHWCLAVSAGLEEIPVPVAGPIGYVIRRCLHPKPKLRISSATELNNRLRRAFRLTNSHLTAL